MITINVQVNTVAGSSATAARLKITLTGYGSSIPQVVGSEIIGGLSATYQIPATGLLSFTVTGNDTISPAGTYYCIQLFDAKENCIAANNYRFVGAGTLDLTTQLPYDPTLSGPIIFCANLNNQGAQGPPGGVAGQFLPAVTPQGVIDGNNRSFTIAGNPAVIQLFKNGTLMDGTGGDYTATFTSANVTTITYTQASTPKPATATDAADTHVVFGYTSAGLEDTVAALVAPEVVAQVQAQLPAIAAPIVSQQVTVAVAAQVPQAVLAALIQYGIIPEPASLAFTGTDGVVYLLQSLYNQLQPKVAPAGTTGAPASYPIQDAVNTTTYLLSVGAGGQLNDPAPTPGLTGAPTFYSLPDPNGNNNKLQVIDGQIALTLPS